VVVNVSVHVEVIEAVKIGSDPGLELEVWGVLGTQPYRDKENTPGEVVPDAPPVWIWVRNQDEPISIGVGSPYRNVTPPAQLQLSDTQYLAIGGRLYEEDTFDTDILTGSALVFAQSAIYNNMSPRIRYREADQIVSVRWRVNVS